MPKGDAGKPGVGIETITRNEKTGDWIVNFDRSEIKPLEIKPPGRIIKSVDLDPKHQLLISYTDGPSTLISKSLKGPQGDAGDDGTDGINGVDGKNGINGSNGSNGRGIRSINYIPSYELDNQLGGLEIFYTDGDSDIVRYE